MNIWAIGDLHLSFGVANKKMNVFGSRWDEHEKRVESAWRAKVGNDDLVLLPGDISWAMKPEEAVPDLEWIAALPGTKVMIRGNHDYWWASKSKVQKLLPPSIHIVHNDVFVWGDVEVAGVRLWDTPEYSFQEFTEIVPNPREKPLMERQDNTKIFDREVNRLKMSLNCFSDKKKLRIVMTHYPPIGADLAPSIVSELLESYNVRYCVFGHLHNIRPGSLSFGERGGVEYIFTSCDYLDCKPIHL